MADIILEARDLKKYYPVTKGLIFSKVIAQVKAVDGISFTVNRGMSLASSANQDVVKLLP